MVIAILAILFAVVMSIVSMALFLFLLFDALPAVEQPSSSARQSPSVGTGEHEPLPQFRIIE